MCSAGVWRVLVHFPLRERAWRGEVPADEDARLHEVHAELYDEEVAEQRAQYEGSTGGVPLARELSSGVQGKDGGGAGRVENLEEDELDHRGGLEGGGRAMARKFLLEHRYQDEDG